MNGGRKSGRVTEVVKRGLKREEEWGSHRIPVGGKGGGGHGMDGLFGQEELEATSPILIECLERNHETSS
jgi:hypothetical protein